MTQTQNSNNVSSRIRRPELMIFVAAFSAFLATFNETFLNVAFTQIMDDLNVGVATVQWLSTAYMLGAAVMVPISAFLYRSIPTRKLYLFTVALLVIGSAVCASAGNFTVLLAGRIVQAFGTGMLIPIGMNITLEVAPKRKLGAYMGLMGAMTTLGPSSSVILAGLFLALADWHAMIWFFFTLTVLCFICGALMLDNISRLTYPKLDALSVIYISIALIGILYGISTVFMGNLKLAVAVILLGAVFLSTFIRRQSRLEQPLIKLTPLAIKPFALGVLLNMLALLVIFAMNIVTPMFLQSGWGVSALAASLTLFPAILLSCFFSPLAGRIYDKHGAAILLPLGFILIGLAAGAIGLTHSTGNIYLLSLLYIPVICGSALIIGPVQSLALSNLSFEENPHGVTIMSTGFQIAGCLGASLFSGLYSLYPTAGGGFTASCLLAAATGALGLLLALLENKWSNQQAAYHQTDRMTGIAAFMNRTPYSVSNRATALDALLCMAEHKTSGLPIVNDQTQVCGFISDGDIIRYMGGLEMEPNNFSLRYPLWQSLDKLDDRLAKLSSLKVMELATKEAVCIEQNASEQELFHIFADKRIKKVPVLNQGRLSGIVSRSDLLRQLINQAMARQQ